MNKGLKFAAILAVVLASTSFAGDAKAGTSHQHTGHPTEGASVHGVTTHAERSLDTRTHTDQQELTATGRRSRGKGTDLLGIVAQTALQLGGQTLRPW